MASLSKTRWWSRWEIYHQLLLQYGDIEPFLLRNPDLGPSLRPKLLGILADINAQAQLKCELAIVVDFGEHFVKATYNLEGDGPLVLSCYEIIKLRAVIQSAHYPNVMAISRQLTAGNLVAQQQWIDHAMKCVENGAKYFQDKFGDDSQLPISAF